MLLELWKQGWARDVKARDRDKTETLTSRDRAETETRRQNFETRPRQDVCSFRDVIDRLKYKFFDCNNRPRCYLSRSLLLAC